MLGAIYILEGTLQFGHFRELKTAGTTRALSLLGVERGSRDPRPEGVIGLNPGIEWHEVKECLRRFVAPTGLSLQSRRDSPIVAWHEVPGQRDLKIAVR
jgi:hypothetical protein